MTMLAPTSAPALESVRLRPISWRSITRAAWLQYRGTFVALGAGFVALAATMIVGELQVHAAYASYLANGCTGIFHDPCGTIANEVNSDGTMFSALAIVLHVAPVLVGMFVGAPLFSRELESGTFRFTWTQAVGRRRQVLITLALFAVVVAVGACLLGLLFDVYAHPFEVIGYENHWISRIFEGSPVVLFAWSLFALASGTFFGVVIGRTVAAMATSAAAVGVLAAFSYQFLKWLFALGPKVISHIAPLTNTGTLNTASWPGFGPARTWLVRAWITGPTGSVLSENQVMTLQARLYETPGSARATKPEQWLAVHHYVFSLAYQPANRYGFFQGAEVFVLLVMATMAAMAILRLVRTRRS